MTFPLLVLAEAAVPLDPNSLHFLLFGLFPLVFLLIGYRGILRSHYRRMDKPWFGIWRARDYKLRDFNWWEWTLVVLILAVALDLMFMGNKLRKYFP